MYPVIFWGGLFRSLRKSRSLLQKEVAILLHTSRQSYSNLETGRAHPKPEYLAVLSYVFDIDLIDYVFKSLPTEFQAELKAFRSEQRRRRLKESLSSKESESGKVIEPKKRKIRRPPTLIRPNLNQDPLELLLDSTLDMVAEPGPEYGKKKKK
jgi:transcriptional regulator with XRE-family HTH domain